MAIIVNTNLASLQVQRNLNTTTDRLNKTIERMTTGLKINHAADDAAGLYIANGLETQIRGSEVAQGNIQTGVNILQIAEGDLSLIEEHILRIRDLATQAASDYYSEDARKAMADEAVQRYQEINRIAKASNFNGINLLDGTLTEMRLQIGPDSPAETNALTVSGVFGDSTSAGIELTTAAADTDDKKTIEIRKAFQGDAVKADGTLDTAADNGKPAENAAAFIATCDNALNSVTTKRAAIGAVQNRLDSAYNSLLVQVENLTSAKSTIMDADIAKESSEYTKQQILQQASASLLVQANQAPSIALSLLQ
ncbi:flagellin FliC [bacterium]|nr:flagellin FliC [bacterium]